MIVSDARLQANRINALRSTGPKTAEGKDRSRMNSLKHGLTSEVVRAPEDREAVQGRTVAWFGSLKPQNFWHGWLVDEISVITLRIDRAERIERIARDTVSLRAETAWDDDRRSEAEAIGLGLADRPASVVDELRRIPHGCDWLIERWAMLARAADRSGGWDPAQRSLAFDLLGVPPEGRDGTPGERFDLHGRLVDSADDPAAVSRREVDALLARRSEVADLDTLARALAEGDVAEEPSAEIRRLRRYEASLHRRLRWCLSQLNFESPRLRANSEIRGHFVPWTVEEPVPVPAPEPAREPGEVAPTHPVADPGIDEAPTPGAEPEPELEPTADDRPMILPSRADRKLTRAESRSEARQRRLDRRRA